MQDPKQIFFLGSTMSLSEVLEIALNGLYGEGPPVVEIFAEEDLPDEWRKIPDPWNDYVEFDYEKNSMRIIVPPEGVIKFK